MSEILGRGTERLFSVKYLQKEAKIAYNFLLPKKFLDGRSIHVQSCTIFVAHLINSQRRRLSKV